MKRSKSFGESSHFFGFLLFADLIEMKCLICEKNQDPTTFKCISNEYLYSIYDIFRLFVISVIFRFGFEGWIWVLIASVPDLCILLPLDNEYEETFICFVKFGSRPPVSLNCSHGREFHETAFSFS